MRTYTIALSIVAHVIAACAAVIVPLLATDELPAPRTATEFMQVVPPPQPPPPPPRVSAAAIEVVRQWRFTPTLLNEQPMPVVMTVTVAFKLR